MVDTIRLFYPLYVTLKICSGVVEHLLKPWTSNLATHAVVMLVVSAYI